MCASAFAILHWNAIPVFVDIEEDTFCMDPEKIEEKISERTRAILLLIFLDNLQIWIQLLRLPKNTI